MLLKSTELAAHCMKSKTMSFLQLEIQSSLIPQTTVYYEGTCTFKVGYQSYEECIPECLACLSQQCRQRYDSCEAQQ